VDTTELLSGLDEAQRAAVTSAAAPLCVHAGAGSGKTRVLTRRIAHRATLGELDPGHTVALTFTRKAAGELRARLRATGLPHDVAAGTFHAIAYAQLRGWWDDRRETPPTLLDRKPAFVAELLGRRRELAPAVVAEIEWASARAITPSAYLDRAAQAGRRSPLPGDEMAHLLDRYAEAKTEARVIDFDDLLQLALRIMRNESNAAKAFRWRFRHFFVDEFQDVNPLQHQLVRGWLGDGTDLFVVGDPHQAIYSWNGADPRYLDRFEDVFPVERYPDVGVLHLRDNYRSTPQILATAAAVLGTSRLVAHVPDGTVPDLHAHADEDAEARSIVRSVRSAHEDGRPWRTQAILVRTVAQGAALGQALGRAAIPHQLRGSDQLLARPLVKRTLGRLRRERFDTVIGDLRPGVEDDEEDGDAEDRDALLTLAHEYEALDPSPTGDGFANWMVAALRAGDTGDHEAVTVSTFHAAKGLEWPVVHLAGLEDGFVPVGHAKSPEARDEEQRLLYVAITRAQEELHLHWSRTRVLGDAVRERRPSPWLGPIEVALARLAEAARPVDGRHHLADPHDALRARAATADPVVERLEAWRAHAAKVARVPAEAILDDITLRAIAAARPDGTDDLVAVPGLGPVKAARFGDELLAAVRDSG
jgi:DNA helicase-2/ATP-dependent DNA helicase PcrA